MLLLKGEPVAEAIYARVRAAASALREKTGEPATLVTVLVGNDPASQVYVRRKQEACARLGLGHRDRKLAEGTSQSELLSLIRELNADASVDGILVQRPLPKHLAEAELFDLIDPAKDVDCFSPFNVGLLSQGRGKLLPCTPAGILEMLDHYKIPVAGRNALVVGRSEIVGKPMAALLLQRSATVTVAHSKTADLAGCVARADLVVAAIGRARFLGGNLPWKRDAVVIDVGINRGADNRIAGDVDYNAVKDRVAAISPVPGGVGPLTIAMLMANTVRAASLRRGHNP